MLEENDIRPKKFNELQEEAIIEDIKFLIERKNDFISIDCPTCGTENSKIEIEKNGFTYFECSNCNMLYMSPRPSEKILSEFYPNSRLYEVFNTYIFPTSSETRKEKLFKPRVQKVLELSKKYKIVTDSILEIGSGFGFFLEELVNQKIFNRVVGTEASNSLFETAKSKEYDVYNGILENLKIDEKFNFVASFEVIEHVFNPVNFLKKVHALLDNNGVILLSFPNYDGFDIGILREKSSAIDHEHLNYFNEKSISLLLENTGYKVLEIYTPGLLDSDIVKLAIEKNDISNSFLRKLLCSDDLKIIEKFQKFLQDNKLSSHMIVCAQKV